MKPYSRSIFDLFDGKRRYEVPLFQRQYVWNLENHWEPLWEDIERKFVQRLNGSPSTPHFLGAMVLDQRRVYGNLTLLTQPLNSSVSNSAFEIKKPEILKNSGLALNRYFQDKESWDEGLIETRGELLFTHASERWSYPARSGVQ